MRQSEPLYQGMETCVTATWMKLMYQMLRLTGDSRCADRLETSLYNALLGAMVAPRRVVGLLQRPNGERCTATSSSPTW